MPSVEARVATPIHIVALTAPQLDAARQLQRASGAAVAARALRKLVRSARGRGLGWRGRAPSDAVCALLRRAGVVLAAIGRPETLHVAQLAEWGRAGPLLVVIEAPQRHETLEPWLAQVSALRLPTLRLAYHRLPLCAPHVGEGDLAVTLSEAPAVRPADAACVGCARTSDCPGPTQGSPIQRLEAAVSNQFDLVEVDSTQPELAQEDNADAASVVRRLVLRTADGDRLFHCDNAGWSTEAIDGALQVNGQAWLDASTKARLDDFAMDLQSLKRLKPAERTLSGRWSPSVWQVSKGDLFAPEEAALRAHISGLRGLVVDIGAGPIRYLQTLADQIATGAVRYMAVEPDLAELQRTAAALPGAMLSQGVGEHLPMRDGCADHLLMLRSFNHLRDVAAAFREATRVARPGATMLVVDNVAFGLLRTPAQVARARAISVGQTPFEHYRNANADQAVEAIEATGAWHLGEVRAVIPGRANQWAVHAVRRSR